MKNILNITISKTLILGLVFATMISPLQTNAAVESEAYINDITYAKGVLAKVLIPNANFSEIGKQEMENKPDKIVYGKDTKFSTFISELPTETKNIIEKMKPGEITKDMFIAHRWEIGTDGNAIQNDAVQIIKLLGKKKMLKHKKEVYIEHILISYKEAADKSGIPNITRSETEAIALINTIKKNINSQKDFERLAKENSDDASNKGSGGKLEEPAIKEAPIYVAEFNNAALKLKRSGDISDIIKTQFGYHIMYATKVKNNVRENKAKLEVISIALAP